MNTASKGIRIGALDPDSPYTSRLSARSALYSELHVLLEQQTEALSRAEYRKLIIEENCLARSSESARRKLWKELASRYILDCNNPLFAAFWEEWTSSHSEEERALCAYCLLALHDRLVADLGRDLLFPLLRRAPAEIQVADVLSFIERSQSEHPEVANWTEKTKKAVAQKYTASIRDFGLATGRVKKLTVRPALYGAPVRLLTRALRLEKLSPLQIVQSDIFRLLAIHETEVIDVLGDLNRLGELRFRMQGDIVELELDGKH